MAHGVNGRCTFRRDTGALGSPVPSLCRAVLGMPTVRLCSSGHRSRADALGSVCTRKAMLPSRAPASLFPEIRLRNWDCCALRFSSELFTLQRLFL